MPNRTVTAWDIFIDNSQASYIPDNSAVVWTAIGLSVLVWWHSLYLRRCQWPMIRVATDIATVCFLGECACYLACSGPVGVRCSLSSNVVLFNLVGGGVFGGIVQAIDNYVTYARWVLLVGPDNVSWGHQFCAVAWVVIFLNVTWFPFDTFAPAFANLNDPAWSFWNNLLSGYIYYSAYWLYDLVYCVLVLQFLRQNELDAGSLISVEQRSQTRALGLRVLLHSLVSVVGAGYQIGNTSSTVDIEQDLCIVLGIHLFLNFKCVLFVLLCCCCCY
jgi:hypothetical protein